MSLDDDTTSTPAAAYRSEYGLLTPRSSAYSPAPSFRSSSRYPSQRPSTAPHAPSPVIPDTRSHSRLAASIKSFLSRSTLASPSPSSTTHPESEPSSRLFHHSPPPGKWPMTPPKSRPPNLDISASAMPSLNRANTPIDVHRRYPSEALAKIYNADSGTAPPTSQVSLDLSAQNAPKTRNVLRRRPSGSAKLSKGRERGMSSPTRTDVDRLGPLPRDTTSRRTDVPLTPAGAVVEAYKQQELFRNDKFNPPKLSIDDLMSPRTSQCSGYDQEHSVQSPMPHYNAFRSSAERRLQPSSDDRLGKPSRSTPRLPLHHPSASDATNRSLTRRVSSRWQKVKGGIVPEEPHRDRGHSKGRPSLQELWGNDKSPTRSTGRSMDGMLNLSEGAWSSPVESSSRPGAEGGKFWRLMRRISTGGLRDRFQTEKAVPPVPAIPKELLVKANQGEGSNELVSVPPHPSSSPRDKDPTSLTTQNIASVAVTSTSSNSSDVASTHFFNKTHSARSSVSSYGEAAGLKEISLDRHIIAPIEQLRLGEDHAQGGKSCGVSRSPRRSASVPVALKMPACEDVCAPLLSPRRQTTSGDTPSLGCSRPVSARTSRFSGLLGGRQSQTADGLVPLSPPPRPARLSRRTTSSPSHSLLIQKTDLGARQLDRTLSGQSDTTARATPEPRTSHDQEGPTTFTYRELGAPRRPPLSEREKVDIWNELLDRSDRAGGTLHIGGSAELLSDNLRFSMHSED